MSPNDLLFHKEEAILAKAQSVSKPSSELDPDRLWSEFSLVTKAYKRLLRQVKQLTKLSDRYQRRLHNASVELDAELGRHVGQEIKEEILKGSGRADEIREQHLTVLFIDIRDFTAFAENQPPEQVIRFLKNYYEYSLGIVHKHGGLVKSFMGDGVMLVFGYNQKQHTADSPIRFSLEILEQLPDFNREQGTDIRLGIGVHSGPTAVGNIGNRERREFAVIGNTVNMASRIEAATKIYRTPLLFSQATKDILQSPPAKPRWVDRLALRGQQQPVDLFTFDNLLGD